VDEELDNVTLTLPSGWRVHPTFHISRITTMAYTSNARPVDLESPEVEWIVLDITGLKRTRTGAIVAQVVWDGDYEPTWEPLDNLRHCPSLVTTCATRKNVLSLLPAWFTTLADDDVSDDFQVDEVTAETQGIAMPPLTAPSGMNPINFFQAMYFPPNGSIATFRGFPQYYTRFSPAELAAYFPHHQARGVLYALLLLLALTLVTLVVHHKKTEATNFSSLFVRVMYILLHNI
jgi:hypothetical protein